MAFNPLQERMQQQTEIPASHGMTANQAQNAIAALLDDDGYDVGHTTVGSEEEHQRGNEVSDDQAQVIDTDDLPENEELDDQNPETGDESEDDGDTAQAEGDDDAPPGQCSLPRPG